MAQPVDQGVSPWLGAGVAVAASTRPAILDMSRQAEAAVTQPHDPGAFPTEWRHAVAARIAAMNAQPEIAAHYLACVSDAGLRGLADPAAPGRDARERIILAFMDKVAREPRAVAAEDIEGLKAAGIAEADIVRLCELNAFMSYQARVLAGLALLKGASE